MHSRANSLLRSARVIDSDFRQFEHGEEPRALQSGAQKPALEWNSKPIEVLAYRSHSIGRLWIALMSLFLRLGADSRDLDAVVPLHHRLGLCPGSAWVFSERWWLLMLLANPSVAARSRCHLLVHPFAFPISTSSSHTSQRTLISHSLCLFFFSSCSLVSRLHLYVVRKHFLPELPAFS